MKDKEVLEVISEKEYQALKEAEEDMVNHPVHYNEGRFEVIEIIEDWKLGFHLGNAIKYIARAEHKGNFKEDIKKSIWYLERLLEGDRQ